MLTRQQLSLDSHYPAHTGYVRERILFEPLYGVRLARPRSARLLLRKERLAYLSVRSRRLLQRLTESFESDSVIPEKGIPSDATASDGLLFIFHVSCKNITIFYIIFT